MKARRSLQTTANFLAPISHGIYAANPLYAL